MVAQKTLTIDLREFGAVKIAYGYCKAAVEVPVAISQQSYLITTGNERSLPQGSF